MSEKTTIRGIKRLEVTMRDVLDGLEDAANYMSYQSTPEIIEILSIEAPGRVSSSQYDVININKIKPLRQYPGENIVEYLIQRELRKLA